MKDLIFVVRNDGTYEQVPNKNLRSQENYSDNFVVIANRVGVVKAKIKLLSRTDRVEVKYLVPSLESVESLIGDKPYFQDYASANVWRGAVPKKLLQEISMSYAGQVEVSFSFTNSVLDSRALVKLGELSEGDLPESAENGEYYIIRYASYTKNDITWTYGQQAIWEGEWIKGGTYKVIGTTTTQKMNVEPTLIGEEAEFDTENEDEYLIQLGEHAQAISELEIGVDDHELRISTNEQDINKIEDGTTVVDKALKDDLGNTIKSTYANKLDLAYSSSNNRIAITLKGYDGTSLDADLIELPKATTSADGLMSKEDKVYVNGLPSALALKENKSEKGVANGYASLDGSAKIHTSQLPDSILGQLEYKGTFNPSSGYPVSPEKGWFYIAIANALISGVDYKVGDWAVYNGVSWDKVDNTDAVASVNGKLGVVVLYGNEIQVGNGDTWTIEQRIVNIYAELNNRYTKAQTYSNAEIEQRITDLLGLVNLQDTAVEFSAGVYDLSYNGLVVSPFDYSLVSPYNWVILQVLVGTQAEYTIFKPSVSTNGVGINLPLTQKDVYAEIMRNGSNFEFSLKKKNDNTLDTTTATMKAWGIKLDGIDASDISYNNETVESALDSLLVPAYITATHEALQTEITATNAFEINNETGDVIKITGNEPTNLVVNSDFSDGTTGWSLVDATGNVTGGIYSFTSTAQFGGIQQPFITDGSKYYISANIKATSGDVRVIFLNTSSYILSNETGSYENISGIIQPIAGNTSLRIGDFSSSGWGQIEVDYVHVYNISQMELKGVKNDEGVLFANLTNEEIKSQLDIWVENGFPTVVEKLVSKSDNLFNAEFKTLTSLASENLISNSDLLIDSNSDGIPDGFTYLDATNQTLSDGIATFTATAQFGRIQTLQNFSPDIVYYFYAELKTDKPNAAYFAVDKPSYIQAFHSGSNEYELISLVGAYNALRRYGINDYRNGTTGQEFSPISIKRMGAFNITDLVSRGILPSGLSNNEYKEMIDKAMFANVPLRETNYIAVEPSKAYKLIKVSSNEVTHKVIEYTTDNQVVKITPVVYTTNKFTFTTHALTSKIKLISDLMNRPTQILTNPNFDNGTTGWISSSVDSFTVANGQAIIVTSLQNGGIQQESPVISGHTYYYSMKLTNTAACYFETSAPFSMSPISVGTNQVFSKIQTHNATTHAAISYIRNRYTGLNTITVDYVFKYDITDFINAGVKDDNGTLFSRLTNGEIKDQMDIWTEVGFPDHVIHALYPNGVDSAIALKYNDADDVFRPQQIDELPLNLTLRSGEYWQDGYVVKQNGNAEYYPLDTKFSAWNYGQLEAVYTSGVPADFDIQYAQNTAAQVKTTQEFLVEAREQLDYVTEGYDNLVEKLGDAILSDKYDSYAGITSDTYEYYTLEGIKEGNTLAIQGAGQSIQNLLGKGGTVNATTTTRGITVTYDSVTGVFTANGTATAGAAFNITLATGMDFGLPVGTPMQLMRYYDDADGGTVDLNGSYIGYVLVGTSASNRINENSEALYDPYINGSGNLNANHATNKQEVVLQVWAPGIVFTNFKFKIGIYQGLQLRPFILPSGETAKSNVTVYNRTANMLNMPTALNIEDSGLVLTYDPLVQEFLLSGTATETKDISLSATFNVLSGDRLSIKRLYQSGDITATGGTLPRLKLVNSGGTAIVYNDIYKMTAPEGETPTPDVSFNTGTAPADATLTLKLGITNGQVFDNYRFRLMIHDKSTDIGYVAYRRDQLGNISVGANERSLIEFKAIPYGILEFLADSESLNLLYADSITDLNKTYLEYNAGIISPNRKISELTARAELIDNPFRNKVIAVWGDSRESNNPTSDPSGVGDQKDTSWPALLAKKLNATVLNYGLSGGAWAENTVQQDAASAIVNRVQTEDVSASADVIVISAMNDFKLASVLGSPLPANKDKTTFYGAMRLTYDRLATKYPGKKILLVLPQKRYDEDTNYGGGSYYHYLKAQVEVANEYGIPIVDLYHNFPNAKPTFYATNMLNDTHFSAVGNDRVAELVARELIGNGNKGDMDLIPSIPTTDGSYTLKVTITGGIPVFSWVVD